MEVIGNLVEEDGNHFNNMPYITREQAQKELQARQTQQAVPGGQPVNIPGFGPLTAETVAQAQLFAPPKQATALSKAFGFIKPTEQTATERKEVKSFGAINNLIDTLEKDYLAAGGGTFGEGLGARVKGGIVSAKGVAGLADEARVYNLSRKGFSGGLKQIVGEAGRLTDQDIARMQGLIPRLGSTPGEATKLFQNMRSRAASFYGQQASPSKVATTLGGGQAPDNQGQQQQTDFASQLGQEPVTKALSLL